MSYFPDEKLIIILYNVVHETSECYYSMPGIDSELSLACPGNIKLHLIGSSLVVWGTWSTLSLLLFSGSLWSGVVIPVRVPSMDLIELSNHLLKTI